jgi:hypothetical protein
MSEIEGGNGFQKRAERLTSPLWICDADNPAQGRWLTKNISVSGLFLLTRKPWKSGTRRSLEIQHGERRLISRAEVTRVNDEGMGLSFLSPEDGFVQGLLRIFVERFAAGDEFEERRRAPNQPLDLPLRWRHGEVDTPGTLINTYPAGANIRTQGTHPWAGEQIFLQIPQVTWKDRKATLTGEVGCPARIIYLRTDGFGVMFEQQSPEFITALVNLIACSG